MNLHFSYQVLCAFILIVYSVLSSSMDTELFSIHLTVIVMYVLTFHVCVFGGTDQ